MKCPYCKNDMELGIIRGGRDSVKWIPKEKDKGMILSSFIKGVMILEGFDKIEGHFCKECNKVTIDLPEKINI